MRVFLLFVCFLLGFKVLAQQKISTAGMNYVMTNKPNTIIYKDSVYQGSAQFKRLFLDTKDPFLTQLYHKHQSNKIWGSILGTVGTLGVIAGVRMVTDNSGNKTAGWIVTGAGFASSIAGGYLVTLSKFNLFNASQRFNSLKSTTANAGIGLNNNGISLIVKL